MPGLQSCMTKMFEDNSRSTSPIDDLTARKMDLAAFLAEINKGNSKIDAIPLPFYFTHKKTCVFHFRSQERFINAISISCHPNQVEELYSYIKSLL